MAPIADAFGVGAVIRPPDRAAIAATVVWVPDEPLDAPMGGPLVRRESRRELSIVRADLDGAAIPRQTPIEAPVALGEVITGWLTDSEVYRVWDEIRVIVIPDPNWQE
jgi:hypothetical protein